MYRFTWDPVKSDLNLVRRGFDFAQAARIFRGRTIEHEDVRRNYGEQRDGSFRHDSVTDGSDVPMGKQVHYTAEKLPKGRIDRQRVLRMTEAEIMRTSPPELANLPDDFWDDAVVVEPILKEPISLRVDEDVLSWFRKTGPRYQTRMNAVLRRYMEAVTRKPKRRAAR